MYKFKRQFKQYADHQKLARKGILTMKEMFSETLSKIGELFKQLCEQLTGSDEVTRQEWLTEFQKFLCRKPCWATRVVVDSLEELIRAGKYDRINYDLTEKRFPITTDSTDEWEFKMFHFGRAIYWQNADLEIGTADVVNPWEAARIEHLLTYGKDNPEEQRHYGIVALGSGDSDAIEPRVPYLGGSEVERYIELIERDLFAFNGDWRFLAVRKKVSQASTT
jgi:hypothetical protein